MEPALATQARAFPGSDSVARDVTQKSCKTAVHV